MKKKMYLILGLCLMLVSVRAQQKTAAANTGSELKIMSYNIHHANPPSKPGFIDVDAIARVINESKADVVALQEVDKYTKRSGNIDQAKEIAMKTGLHYQFFKAINHDGGEYGLAILSRFPLKKAKCIPLSQEIKAEERILSYVTLKVGKGRQLVFANTHLDATRTHENRNLQMKQIMAELSRINLPVVLCGDLNSVAGSDAINLLDTQFKRTCVTNCAGTVPQINPYRTIDYIATKNLSWMLSSYAVIEETYASDHRPITATFNLN